MIDLKFTTIKSPVPSFIYEGLAEFSADANTYQSQPRVLLEKIAQKLEIPTDMIFLTAGTDESIQLFSKIYGRNAYVFTPTYNVYTDVKVFGGTLTEIESMKDDVYTIDSKHIPDATLIFLANPNNPAGETSRDAILALVQENPDAIIAVDETYAEFADLSVVSHVKHQKNLVVFRSFSKAYGMAGNRIGYCIAQKPILDMIRPRVQWANVSYLSVGAAVTALDHEEYFQSMRDEIIALREGAEKLMRSSGFHMIPSHINAVLTRFDTEGEATRFVDYLKAHDIEVNHGNANSNIGLDNSYVRIAIGTRDDMKTFFEVVQSYSFS